VAEIPTIWLDRPAGDSNFQIAKWLPKYLRWYRFAFGPRVAGHRRDRSSQHLGTPVPLPSAAHHHHSQEGTQ
jgi:hypothetical protein